MKHPAIISNKMENIKKLVMDNEFIEFTNKNEDMITVWFHRINQTFAIQLNARFVKTSKTWKPIERWLEQRSAWVDEFVNQ